MKLIIFDLDGTLLNTLTDLTYSINLMREEYNLLPLREKYIKTVLGNGNRYLVEKSIDSSIPFDDAYAKFLSHYEDHQLDETKLYKNVIKTIRKLKELGFIVTINSNKNKSLMPNIINTFLPNLIDFYAGANQDLYPPKPSPESNDIIINKYGVDKKDVIYVGDTEVDYQTANNSGVRCVLVSYGFRSKKELSKLNHQPIFNNIYKIINYLKKETH